MNQFSLTSYISFLDNLIEAGYQFFKFQDSTDSKDQGYVYLRHDIDFSLDYILPIAELESNKEIYSTYFIQLRSPLYNAISDEGVEVISTLHDLGHDVALHFDLSLCGDQLEKYLLLEINILREFFQFANTNIISFHRIGNQAYSLQELRLPYDIRHTYEKRYFTEVSYFSDSKGQWGSHGNPLETIAFTNKQPMQISMHPLWWVEGGNSPLEKFGRMVSRTRNDALRRIERTAISFSLAELYEH